MILVELKYKTNLSKLHHELIHLLIEIILNNR